MSNQVLNELLGKARDYRTYRATYPCITVLAAGPMPQQQINEIISAFWSDKDWYAVIDSYGQVVHLQRGPGNRSHQQKVKAAPDKEPDPLANQPLWKIALTRFLLWINRGAR